MRTVLSGFLTLVAMAAIVIAVPTTWLTQRIVETGGFTSLVAPLAGNDQVKESLATEIADQIASRTHVPAAAAIAKPFATRYTQSPQFPLDFVDIVAQQHRWLFDAPTATSPSTMQLDIAPMANRVIKQTGLGVHVPGKIVIPIADNDAGLHAGSYHRASQQVRTLGRISTAAAVIAGLLALLIGRRRGTVLAWLGVGALASGAACWAVAVYYGAYVKDQIAATSTSAKTVAGLVVDSAADSLQRLGVLAGGVGAGVIVVGVLGRLVFGRR
ncbi:MAG: hypothetical protein QM673_10535 [Gordonia sp. (in: high G+C Gram-positive bacteria)]